MLNITFPTTLTSSLDLDPCTYRWILTRVFGMRKARFFQKDLDFGAAAAEAIYAGRKAYYIEGLSAKDAVATSKDIVDTKFTKLFHEAMEERKARGFDAEKIKTPDRLVDLLEKYWDRFPLHKEELIPFLLKQNTFSAEEQLLMPLGLRTSEGKEINLAVKPDLLAIGRTGTYLVDEKTLTANYVEQQVTAYLYQMRPQFLLYSVAIGHSIGSGKLDVPALANFVVRRLEMAKTLSSANDKVYPIEWKIELSKAYDYFAQFKSNIKRRLELAEVFSMTSYAQQSIDQATSSPQLIQTRSHSSCYEYGRPCPLLEHCAAGRSLEYLGFSQSTVDENTKEITFIEED